MLVVVMVVVVEVVAGASDSDMAREGYLSLLHLLVQCAMLPEVPIMVRGWSVCLTEGDEFYEEAVFGKAINLIIITSLLSLLYLAPKILVQDIFFYALVFFICLSST